MGKYILVLLFCLVSCTPNAAGAKYAYLACKDKKGVKLYVPRRYSNPIIIECNNGFEMTGHLEYLKELYPVKEEK